MADTVDLKSTVERREGSSPSPGTAHTTFGGQMTKAKATVELETMLASVKTEIATYKNSRQKALQAAERADTAIDVLTRLVYQLEDALDRINKAPPRTTLHKRT